MSETSKLNEKKLQRCGRFVAVCSLLLFGGAFAQPQREVPYKVEVVAKDLRVVWSIVFTSPKRMLFTERPGRVRVMENGQLQEAPLLTLEDIDATGKLGAMGMVLHPRFSRNHWLYLAYSYKTDAGPKVRVVRFKDNQKDLTDRTVIIEDNPFVNQPNARPEIWSYGHRNSQGLDFQPGSKTLFESEHGPTGGDEINIIEKGKNYGWPTVHHEQSNPAMVSPLTFYGLPSPAPGSTIFYRGNAFPQFRNNLLVGCLRGECILRFRLDGSKIVSQERLLEKQYGRIREVAEAPDGSIYFTTSQFDPPEGSGRPEYDQILRLVPNRSTRP